MLGDLIQYNDALHISGPGDTDNVVVWPDESGNGYHLYQGNSSWQPYFGAAGDGVGTGPAVVFDGVHDFLQSGTAPAFEGSGFGHAMIIATPPSVVVAGVYGHGQDSGYDLLYEGASLHRFSGALGLGGSADGNAHLFVYKLDYSSGSVVESFYLDGVLNATNSGGPPSTSAPLLLGAFNGSGAFPYPGSVGLNVLWGHTPTDDEIAKLHTYAQTNWGTP